GVAITRGANNSTIGASPTASFSEIQALANNIAFNKGPGVWIFTLSALPENPYDNAVRGNSIHDNVGLGIDLGGDYPTPGPDGITLNASNDFANHIGPNNLQNFPILTSAS